MSEVLRLPCLIYLIDEDTHPILPKFVDFGGAAKKLSRLKSQLKKTHVVSTFSSPADLAAKVSQDLGHLITTLLRAPSAEIMSHIASNATFRHPIEERHFQYFKKELHGVFDPRVPDAILRESLELSIAGDMLAAAFVLSRGAGVSLGDAVDGLVKARDFIVGTVDEGMRILAAKRAKAESPLGSD